MERDFEPNASVVRTLARWILLKPVAEVLWFERYFSRLGNVIGRQRRHGSATVEFRYTSGVHLMIPVLTGGALTSRSGVPWRRRDDQSRQSGPRPHLWLRRCQALEIAQRLAFQPRHLRRRQADHLVDGTLRSGR